MVKSFRQISDRRPGLAPPQFSLRLLLLVVAVVGAVLTIGLQAGPVAALVAILAVLSVVAHMAGTAIGGQLRSNGTTPLGEEAQDDDDAPSRQPISAEAEDYAPTNAT